LSTVVQTSGGGIEENPTKPVIIEGEEEFKVKKILNKRVVKGKKKFLVLQTSFRP